MVIVTREILWLSFKLIFYATIKGQYLSQILKSNWKV